MLDTKGPEIRTGILSQNKPIEIKAGQELIITTDYSHIGDNSKIACSYASLPESVSVGSNIYIADGALTCRVKEVKDESVTVICQNSCLLGERKNMNLPGAIVNLPTLTQ